MRKCIRCGAEMEEGFLLLAASEMLYARKDSARRRFILKRRYVLNAEKYQFMLTTKNSRN